MNIKSANWLDI